jgi:RNA polymerase I-associated factor PAF67
MLIRTHALATFVCINTAREMRFRHMTQNIPSSSTITDCFDAWANYSALFDALLDCRDTEFIITASWAFDIVQEFVYQVLLLL